MPHHHDQSAFLSSTNAASPYLVKPDEVAEADDVICLDFLLFLSLFSCPGLGAMMCFIYDEAVADAQPCLQQLYLPCPSYPQGVNCKRSWYVTLVTISGGPVLHAG